MFLKVPEGFQRKKISSCAETKLVPKVVTHLGRRADGEGVPLGGAQPGEHIIILLVDRGKYRSAVADRGERMPVTGAQQDYISHHPLISVGSVQYERCIVL